MGTGGSRYGAGRPGWRRKCEHSLALDIRKLHARGCLETGSSYGWYWSREGEPCGNIGFTVYTDSVQLSYTRRREDHPPETFRYHVPVDRTPCHFGASRQWFRCPWCSRRCALIYGLSRDGYFACRVCMRLAYSSEAEDMLGRLWRKTRKLEAKLGENYRRPKGMHTRTYERILEQVGDVEEEKDAAFYLGALSILRRLAKSDD